MFDKHHKRCISINDNIWKRTCQYGRYTDNILHDNVYICKMFDKCRYRKSSIKL